MGRESIESMGSMTPPPSRRLEVGAPSKGADLLDFSETAAITVLNYLCILIVEADKATRSLGEQRMKGKQLALVVCNGAVQRCGSELISVLDVRERGG